MQRINKLYPIPLSKLFDQQDMDVIGPLPIILKRNWYIIIIVEYLFKWQKAKAISETNALNIANFLYQNIIC